MSTRCTKKIIESLNCLLKYKTPKNREVAQLQTEIYRHKAWLVVEPRHDIFFDTDGDEQCKASIDLASHRMMETFF